MGVLVLPAIALIISCYLMGKHPKDGAFKILTVINFIVLLLCFALMIYSIYQSK